MRPKLLAFLSLASVCCISIYSAEPGKKPIRPRTVKQAVEIVKTKWLSKIDIDWILRNPEDQISAQLHLGLGTQIRNEFGLWADNDELRKACGQEHPDYCSGIIISELWKSIRLDNDPNLVKQLDVQFNLMTDILIDYKGFRDLKTGEWLASLNSQIQIHLNKINTNSSNPITFSIRVLGDPDMNGYTRAEFSEDGKGPVSFTQFLGWFSWRNGFTVRHNPPFIEFNFTKKCSWPQKPQGSLYQNPALSR